MRKATLNPNSITLMLSGDKIDTMSSQEKLSEWLDYKYWDIDHCHQQLVPHTRHQLLFNSTSLFFPQYFQFDHDC